MDCIKYASLYYKEGNNCYYDDIDFYEYLYLDNNEKNKYLIKCFKGHELIFCNGNIKKPYFRHKQQNDYNNCFMSKWHFEWQSNFNKDEIEVEFPKKENQKKLRRADIFLKETNLIIELQHSPISKNEVRDRNHDYKIINNKKIYWIIDGNNKIIAKNINDKYYLEFEGCHNNNWRIQSFIKDNNNDDDTIFVDINEKIYIVSPKLIKNNMINVIKPYDKKDFINLLKTDINKIIEDIPYQFNLYIKQQGAGNGKTYGIIQSIDKNEDFILYTSYIIVSKQHSAKSIIFNEFIQQYNNGYLENIINIKEEITNKQYIITYTNKITNKECNIVICTIDSFMYRLKDENYIKKSINQFEAIIQSIINTINIKDKIKYNNLNLKLNKETCLIIDETQDLDKNYGEAIIKIMKNSYIDAYIVGDKLQSISIENNAFLYLNNYNDDNNLLHKIKYNDTNICRRFINKKLISFINDKIPFNYYNLKEIEPYKNNNDDNNSYEVFDRISINIDLLNNENNFNEEINFILEKIKNEIYIYNRIPEDFLIITPFTNNNWFCEGLERAIQELWSNYYNQNNYKQYVIFHKSEYGTSINLDDSNDKTRIVSIHTSKGQGRKVVFVIGMTENGLLKFTDGINKNLIYHSLIHVALTRQKEKLYIRLDKNNDDIYKLFKNDIIDNYNKLESNIDLNKFIKNYKYNYFNIIYDNFIKNSKYNDFNIIDEIKRKEIIDTYHHNIRFSCMYIGLLIQLNNYDNKKQILLILKQLINCDIKKCDNWEEYNKVLETNYIIKKNYIKKLINNNQKQFIPILNIKSNNNKYYNIINKNIINIQNKIENNNLNNLCPIERIILTYMIYSVDNPFHIIPTITELFNIIDIFNNCFNYDEIKGHNKCICKTINGFNNNSINENNENYKYLRNFYEEMMNLNKIYKSFLNHNYSNINFLINQNINLYTNQIIKKKENNISIYKKFNIIGYNDKYVFNIYIKPQFNDLNYNEILFESIIDTFIIKNNSDKNDKLYNELNNKLIKIIIFSFDINNYFEIEFELNNDNEKIIKDIIKDYLIKKYKNETKNYFNLFNKDKYKFFELCNEQSINFINKFSNKIEGIIEDNTNTIEITENKFNEKLIKEIVNEINNLL